MHRFTRTLLVIVLLGGCVSWVPVPSSAAPHTQGQLEAMDIIDLDKTLNGYSEEDLIWALDNVDKQTLKNALVILQPKTLKKVFNRLNPQTQKNGLLRTDVAHRTLARAIDSLDESQLKVVEELGNAHLWAIVNFCEKGTLPHIEKAVDKATWNNIQKRQMQKVKDENRQKLGNQIANELTQFVQGKPLGFTCDTPDPHVTVKGDTLTIQLEIVHRVGKVEVGRTKYDFQIDLSKPKTWANAPVCQSTEIKVGVKVKVYDVCLPLHVIIDLIAVFG